MKGIIADINVLGHVSYLVQLMQADPWGELWRDLAIGFFRFADVGLLETSSDLEIWQRCQAEQLILITDNRNDDSIDSLEAAIRQHGTRESLPVFNIGNVKRFRRDRDYAGRVMLTLDEYLLRIDSVRGSGRLYLP
ncbi:MAG: hypothetical protein HY040_28560 [Planctomycetes bacterium]|nr:hypothetical protein [Planctomycetota bacterium]